jgi:hypothetical protein
MLLESNEQAKQVYILHTHEMSSLRTSLYSFTYICMCIKRERKKGKNPHVRLMVTMSTRRRRKKNGMYCHSYTRTKKNVYDGVRSVVMRLGREKSV